MTDWHIAIETSGTGGSVALLRGPHVAESLDLEANQRTASVLAPALARLLEELDRQRSTLRFVSVTHGPGSFTGLRIGVTTAKTLAYALKTPVVPVDTLAVIAAQLFATISEISQLVVGLNAYRGQVYVRQECRGQGTARSSEIWSSEKWKKFLDEAPRNIVIAGNAAPSRLSRPFADEFANSSMPTAAGLGRIAWERFQRGERIDPMQLTPAYLRPSAAEEKAAASASNRS